MDSSRDHALTPVSTRVRPVWTFRSAETPQGAWSALPLSVVRFTPRLTPASTATAGQRFAVPFHIEGAAAGQRLRKLARAELTDAQGNTLVQAIERASLTTS